jgi:ubiquinone/menaquinone biosynthesis C-methylase UbiE
VRRGLRALLPRLHILPALSEPGDIVVVIGADAELTSALAAEVAPDGDVVVVERSVDALEHLRHTSTAPDVSYLVGDAEVLPLPDESVDLVRIATPPSEEAAQEYLRVLRAGGRVTVAGPPGSALNVGERVLTDAGFADVAVVQDDGSPSLTARKQ